MNNEKIAKNSLAGMLVMGAYLVSRLLLTPLILTYISIEEFGLWSFCFVVISFAGLTGTGISSAFVKFTAEFHAQNKPEKISEILATGTFVLAIVSSVISTVIWFETTLLIDFFGIKKPELRELASFLIRGSVVVFLLDLTFSGFKSLLDGLQEITLSRGIWLETTIVEVVLTVIFLHLGWGVKGVFAAYTVRCLMGIVLYFFFARKRIEIRFWPSVSSLKLIFSFGGKVQVLGFIGIFMTSFDRLVVTKMLGLDFAGFFEIGRKFPLMGAGITSAALDSLLPASSASQGKNSNSFSSASGQGKRYGQVFLLAVLLGGSVAMAWPIHEWNRAIFALSEPLFLAPFLLILTVIFVMAHYLLRQLFVFNESNDVHEEVKALYLNGSFYLNLMNAALFSFLAACSPKIIWAWVGAGFEEAVWVMSILSLSVLVNLATGPGTALLRGIGKPEAELEYALLNLVLALCWIPALVYFLELPGAALGTAASTITGSLYFIHRANRLLGISFFEYAERALYPALIPVACGIITGAGLFFIPAASRLSVFLQVTVAGFIYLFFAFLLLKNHPELQSISTTLRTWKDEIWRRGE